MGIKRFLAAAVGTADAQTLKSVQPWSLEPTRSRRPRLAVEK